MQGHKLSGTRQWNRHWQSAGGGLSPVLPMRDFTDIRLGCMRLQTYTTLYGDHFYDMQNDTILLLPNYNKIYFNMSSSTHRFEPIVMSVDFELHINGRNFKSNDLYNLYTSHPERFHNVSISKDTFKLCGQNVFFYVITFNDTTHNFDEYYIDYTWGSSNKTEIDFNMKVVGYDDNYDCSLNQYNGLKAYPFHTTYSDHQFYAHSGIDETFAIQTNLLVNNRYMDGQYKYVYNYIVLPEADIQGALRSGFDINDVFNSNGTWKLGTAILSQDMGELLTGYYQPNYDYPYLLYNGLYKVWSTFDYQDSQSIYLLGITSNNTIQICKTLDTGSPFSYSGETFSYNNEPILMGDFSYLNNGGFDNTKLTEFKMFKESDL